MKVSFVTVAYNTPNLIRVLLRGMEQAKISFPFEYFLVDNGSDGTADMVRERYPWVTVIASEANVGFARACNAAIRLAKGEYVMAINPDLTVFPGELEKIVAHADALPDGGIFGPWVENPNGTRQESCARFPRVLTPILRRTSLGRLSWGRRMLDDYFMRGIDHSQAHDTDCVYGAAMLIRRSLLDAIGGFDERFFMYYEDVDLCRRAWKAGWRVRYVPEARFVHYHQRESVIRAPWEIFMNRLTRIHIASGIRYILKYAREPLPKKGARSEERGAREHLSALESRDVEEKETQLSHEGHEAATTT
jgi:N-acetylglucosaminyl-diphospho-decaprenol L-rhamnosyltransferase